MTMIRKEVSHAGAALSYRFVIVAIELILMSTVLLATVGCGKKEQQGGPRPPTDVVTVTVTPKTVPVTYEFVSQAESSHQVNIVARVNGFLEKILYREGDIVKADQVMFVMDQKPFLAQLAAAKGEVENREAQLWVAQANLDRIKPLAELNAVSKSDLDNAIGAQKSAAASLDEAKARLDKAQIDLGYTTIKSPVTGISSRSQVREGAYLSGVGTASLLTYVAKLDPIWINFSVSQNEITAMRQEVTKGELMLPKDQNFQVEIVLSDGTRYPHTGRLNFAAPSYSSETGTFLVRAEVANPNTILRPGMFVKTYLKGATRPNAIVVPQKAVQETSNGHVVYVVTDKGTAELRPVIAGDWIGEGWIIRQGLKSGDRVIVEGFQKLAPGAPVRIAEEPAPEKKSGDEDKTGNDQKAGTLPKADRSGSSAAPQTK